MTPHEKAKDIYQKMFNNMPHPDETNAAVFTITKQCALIHVEELLNLTWYMQNDRQKYDWESEWKEVKKEIEAL
jgi:hypothetical protein